MAVGSWGAGSKPGGAISSFLCSGCVFCILPFGLFLFILTADPLFFVTRDFCDLAINERGWVGYEELRRSSKVLSTEGEGRGE